MKYSLAIPVPHGGGMYWRLCMWLESIQGYFKGGYYRDTVEGGPVPHNRNAMCHRFLDETDADVLWMVDSDMDPRVEGIEAGGVPLVLEAMERDDVDILSGISFRIGEDKNGPVPCVFSLKEADKDGRKQDVSDRVFAAPPGLHEMRGISTGAACLAIKRRVIEDFKKRNIPWFIDHYHETPEKLGCLKWSEDIHFVRTAQDLGWRFWIDTRIVWGHIKRMDLRDELERARELMARATSRSKECT